MPPTKRTVKGVLGGLLGLVGLSAVAGLLVTATVTPAIALSGYAGSTALTLFDELPSYLDPAAPMEPTTFYGTNEKGKTFQIAQFYEQNRRPVDLDEISPTMIDALLSSEDKDYFSHGGVNLAATVKAAFENFANVSSRGASTITQQFVKNALIQQCEQGVSPTDEKYDEKMQQCWLDAANANGAAGIERKLREMRYAMQIEKDFSKNEILLGYLNLSNWGGTTYGIESAAHRYFGTSAKKLTLSQAATLAGMVQNPNEMRIDRPKGSTQDADGNPINSKEDGYSVTLERRDYVLNQMLKNGHITKEEHDKAIDAPIKPKITDSEQGCAAAGSNAYFCQYVKSVLETDKTFGETKEDRAANLRRGGMDIYTSLDMRVQKTAVKAIHDRVPASMEGIDVGAAGTQIEASTGRILSIAQNTRFSESEKDRKKDSVSAQVYAADRAHHGGNGFSVGSTYKLFTLVRWLEEGHSVNEVLNGRMRVISPFTSDGEVLVNTEPIKNFGNGAGAVESVRAFTAKSLNTGFLAMAQQLDLKEINEVATRMGVHYGSGGAVTEPEFEDDAPNGPFASVLGSKSIAPIQMAGAYATIANKGKYCEPRVIDKIVGRDGKKIDPPKRTCTQAITPEVAATAAYALKGVMNGGTGGGANPYDGTELIGKTGTAEKEHTMLVEGSTEVVTAVWVGNASGLKPLGNYWANGIPLNNMRYWIAKDMQRAANQAYPAEGFPPPDNDLTRRVLKDLPNVVGMSVDEAKQTLTNAGFSFTVGDAVDSSAEKGTIAEQDPGAGSVAGGTTVTISPSNGKGESVPDVSGQGIDEATSALQDAGFDVDASKSCNADGAKVSRTNPAAGSHHSGGTVRVDCRKG